MDIKTFNALNAGPLTQKTSLTPKLQEAASEADQPSFAATAREVAGAVSRSEHVAAAYMVGKADPHSVVEAMASAELAVETAVTIRNRVVEAYQELLRMPI